MPLNTVSTYMCEIYALQEVMSNHNYHDLGSSNYFDMPNVSMCKVTEGVPFNTFIGLVKVEARARDTP